MILLVTHGHPTMVRYRDDHLGRLIQPRHYSSIEATAGSGITWAADNDAFNGWSDEVAERWIKMLNRIEGLPGCKFVAVPDVVGDAEATGQLFAKYAGEVVKRNLPVALVAQDGFEKMDPNPGHYPTRERMEEVWAGFDALFIGGTTEFKLGEYVRELVAASKEQGKWVHMGRVNSLRRMRYAQAIGCDSVDGSKFSKFSDIWIPEGLAAMKGGRQMFLETTMAGGRGMPDRNRTGEALPW